MTAFNIILFDNFETLDVFGPAEIIGKLPETYKLRYFSLHGGIVTSSQQVRIDTFPFSEIDTAGNLLIPGGMGTRQLVDDQLFIDKIKIFSGRTVCFNRLHRFRSSRKDRSA